MHTKGKPMGDYIKVVGIWLVALACSVFMLNYILTNVEINNQTQAISETLQTTLLANQQYSERVETKAFYINKKEFESAFLNNFTQNKGIKIESSEIEFSYLPSKVSSDRNAISGAKVKIKSDGQTYQGTMLIETGTDKSNNLRRK